MKFFLFILLTAVISPIFSQEPIPNGNFEEWESLTNGAENPVGWGGSNFGVSFGIPQTIFMTDDAAVGDYAMLVKTDSATTNGAFDIYPGQAELNEQAFTDGGIPYSGRPLEMTFYSKGEVFPGDTAQVRAWLTRKNPNTQISKMKQQQKF